MSFYAMFLFANCIIWVFANGPVDQDSISGHVIPKTLKMVLDKEVSSTIFKGT